MSGSHFRGSHFRTTFFTTIFSVTPCYSGKRSELRKSQRRKPKRTPKTPSIFHKSDQNVENKKHQLPMAYYLWLPRPVGV